MKNIFETNLLNNKTQEQKPLHRNHHNWEMVGSSIPSDVVLWRLWEVTHFWIPKLPPCVWTFVGMDQWWMVARASGVIRLTQSTVVYQQTTARAYLSHFNPCALSRLVRNHDILVRWNAERMLLLKCRLQTGYRWKRVPLSSQMKKPKPWDGDRPLELLWAVPSDAEDKDHKSPWSTS